MDEEKFEETTKDLVTLLESFHGILENINEVDLENLTKIKNSITNLHKNVNE